MDWDLDSVNADMMMVVTIDSVGVDVVEWTVDSVGVDVVE